MIQKTPLARARATVALGIGLALSSGGAAAQLPDDLDALSDRALYDAACAGCHGADGRGVEPELLAFEEAMPDFTDCDFAAREPDADWVAVAHDGGPARGFSRMMPAFGEALSVEQLTRIMRYVRTLCTDPRWPRGELNLPRALLTEKAFPEDEWVIEVDTRLEDAGAVASSFVYEQRFGPTSQLEVVIPFGWRQTSDPAVPGSTRWVGGLGDIVLGVKRTLYHSLEAGRIFALGLEGSLPTGDETKGLGAAGATLEAFASFGQILPGDAFFQAQAGGESPRFEGADDEVFGRVLLGRTFTQGQWGRAWSPMIELQARRDVERGADTVLDVVPQIQVSLNTRQHVLANVGVLLPATHTTGRSARLLVYVLLDWFDGGFFEGW